MIHNNGDVSDRNREYIRVYKEKLSPQKQQIAELFEGEHYSIRIRLKKAFWRGRWRPSISSELAMRFLMLSGRV